ALGVLHRAGIAHGQVDGDRLVLADGDAAAPAGGGEIVGLVDFRGAVVAASPEQLRADEAQALVATALGVGAETALEVAHDPLGPVYALQLAISYIGLAVPSAAGRIAINIRFFQRHGLPPGSAVAIGAIDGFSGFVVQATLLLSMLLFTAASLDVSLSDAAPS